LIWRSWIFAFCFRRMASACRNSLWQRGLHSVDLCEKAIAIDKMDPICRQAFRQSPVTAGETAPGDGQNGGSFGSILSIGAGSGR
jgi:hypothetical protein